MVRRDGKGSQKTKSSTNQFIPPPGTHSDGDNLLLRVRDSGSRSWVFRYKQNGRAIELGLGSTTDRTLVEAREIAGNMRRAIARGQSPKEVLRIEKPSKTFADYALEYIEHKRLDGGTVSMRASGETRLCNMRFHSLAINPSQILA
ncbi:Arm DNA-binding domain-containing protein [Nitrosomonas ureae]|uniref:Integrase DNA-binding domain-containing protein n=1 Tax=Nitrosomonas ureae TaxID=44577 RepID=A0A1H5X9M0_9PROT|nr:Arm DNA-binding domain-containing protein [Nitrosomonas ureae]SEG08452.1 protein of unknown function [Nitrosomonas ureae]